MNTSRCSKALVCLGWIWSVFVQAISGACHSIGLNITPILYLILILLIITQYRRFLVLNGFEFIGILFFILSATTTALLFPDNIKYIMATLPNLAFFVMFYMIGRFTAQTDQVNEIIYSASIVGILLAYIAYFTSLEAINKDMTFAYVVLPQVVGVIQAMFVKPQIRWRIFSALGIVLVFLLGTRGPFLFALLFLVYKLVTSHHKPVLKAIVLLLSIVALWLVISGKYIALANWLNAALLKQNINSYILHQLITGNTTSLYQRGQIHAMVLAGIQEHWLFGMGLFGDRVITNGIYVHNIIYEILCQYGIVIGSSLLLILLYGIIKILLKNRNKPNYDFFVLCIAAFLLKYFVSSSYLTDIGFFYFLGIMSGNMVSQKISLKHEVGN